MKNPNDIIDFETSEMILEPVATSSTGDWESDADARWDRYTKETDWPVVAGGRVFPPGLGGGGGGGGGGSCLMTLLLWPVYLMRR